MKISMLIENTACREELACEHGLSLYVETKHHKILFDTGQSDAFADNARKMGIDLSAVDIAVLSHGHYDHGGGIQRFLQENDRAQIYVQPTAFGSFWHGEKYIGLAPEIQANPRFCPIGTECSIDEELLVRACPAMPMGHPLSGEGLTVLRGGTYVQDDFCHEHYLSLFEDGRHVLLSGCSHRGVLNIMRYLCPDVLVGGFHFKKLDPEGPGRERLLAAAQELAQYPARYYTCHCTGEEQFVLMRGVLGERLGYFSGGMQMTV